MEDKVFKSSGLPIRRTIELLPDIFQTNANEKFLGATLDALVQPGTLEKISGYIGRKYGKTFNSNDVYIDRANTLRDAYQLEPAVVVRKNNRISEFNDYIDFKNQLKFFGNGLDRDDQLTGNDTYAWAPPIDWDKFVNYREYFWQPVGVDSVAVQGQARETVSSYRVRTSGTSEWIFYPDGLKKNPSITLYRGQTYEFDVNSPGDPFFIRTSNVLGEQSNYTKGVTNGGTQVGKVIFEVPNDAPELLYYQSSTNRDRVGTFRVAEIKENTFLDVEKDVIGKQKYISSNGVKFTNGLRVKFEGQTSPAIYKQGSWVIEGVGDAIRLINWETIELPPISNPNPEVLFDDGGFDDQPFDESLSYPRSKDYITINRSSLDKNPWSRYNRWFHRSVLEYTGELNNTAAKIDENLRAKRPIIEFNADLQLFNHGTVAKTSVDLIDDFTTDIFSVIEGSSGYNIDGEPLTDGYRILFTADTDPLVKNKIFEVKFITVQASTNIVNRRQISLIETTDTISNAGEGLVVKRGLQNRNKMFHFDGETWIRSQEKTKVNQAPRFDVFDLDGISVGDSTKYNTSSFTGSEILSYVVGTGNNDSELGFPLSYLNINNSGDIQFEFDWDRDQFSYQENFQIITELVNKGYYRNNTSLTEYDYKNGWSLIDSKYLQAIIQTITLSVDTDVVISTACDWNSSTRDKTICYVNGHLVSPINTIIENNKKKITFGNTLTAGDTVTFKVYSDAEPIDGYYEIPFALERNPLNQDLQSFTLGQLNDHLGSMVELADGFEGSYPGSGNLRDLINYEQYGRRFLKHSGIPSLSINLLCNKETNIINSIRFASSEYEKFKNNFLTLAIELPFDNGDPVKFVDDILTTISQARTIKSPFVDSDMVGSGAFTTIDYTVEDTGINVFSLGEKFDLSVISSKATYVYINNQQGINGKDYEFDSTFGFVKILKQLNENDNIQIKEYFSTAFNFIPPTPTKMGMYKKYEPEIFIDTTYLDPKKVIRGHDGSITIAFNDFRDELLLELEKRIYNNIKIEYDEETFDIDKTLSSFYKTGTFTQSNFNTVINQEFLRWASTTDIDLFGNNFYQVSNPFTYTYSQVVDKTTREELPGFWRGMFLSLYDTDRPHISPWEMLGFAQKPTWWEDEYGPAPYTSGNLILWEDLRDGLIRQGPRAGQHDRYKRSNLLDIIPTDEDGELKNPLLLNVLENYSTFNNQLDFKFGDVAPAEYAWRKSSSYPFSVIFALCLLRPFEFISASLDKTKVKKNKLGQLVSTASNYFVKISDLLEILNGEITPSGLFCYLDNYLKVDLKDKTLLIEKLENFDINMSNRIGGFVDKSQQKYILDSKNPQASTSSVFIPPENYDIFFNTGSSIQSLTYSGVIIEKTARAWIVRGYDRLNTYFEYYPSLPTNADPKIFVGGVSESYVSWQNNQFYTKGIIVRFNEQFFRAVTAHTSEDVFDATKWVKITQIPLVGAIEASKRTYFDKTDLTRLSYGTALETVQDVVDFLLGYGERLKDLGFVFDEFSSELQAVANWETTAKEFMFWTSHNWAPGAILSVSPAAIKLKLVSTGGVADNLLDSFYEYTILKSDGTKLLPANIDVIRRYNEFALSPVNIRDGIYFARINYVLKEHVVIFSDRTMFNDVMFDKGPGYRQQRIKVLGFRTTDWDGDYTSPGFLFDDVNIQPWAPFVDYKLGDITTYKEFNYVSKVAQSGEVEFNPNNWEKLDSRPETGLVANFDYRISQFEDFYDLDSEGLGSSQRELARHSIGYQSRDYLRDLAEDDVTQYRLYQGFIREKGTNNSIKKIFDKISSVDSDAIELNEEWAFRLGQIGGTDQFNEIEFKIGKDQFKLNPQPIILNDRSIDQNEYKNYIVLSDQDYQIGDSKNQIIQTKNISVPNSGAGYVNIDDVDFVIKNFDELIGNDVTQFNDGSVIWITYETGGWDVLRYKITNVTVVAVAVIDQQNAVITTNRPHRLTVGTIIGLTNIKGLTGFYKIKAANTTTIVVGVLGFDSAPELDQSSFCNIGVFLPARISSTEELIKEDFSILPLGSKVWLDKNANGTWEVLQRLKQYSKTGISEYGVSFPASMGSAVAYIPLRDQTIVSNPGARVDSNDTARDSAVIVYTQSLEGLVPSQVLNPISEIAPELLGSYGTVLTVSPDGRWLLVASPTASGIPSGFKGQYSTSAEYNTNDTVIYTGKLWKANKPILGDGSTINLSSEDWSPVDLHEAQPAAKNLIGTNPGYPKQGCVDIFEFTQGQWTYRKTIISPRPEANELFGSSISIGKQEGIEGTSGDVTLIVKAIDTNGGITIVDAVGTSGLKDATYQNIGGTDISDSGNGASFNITKSGGTYVATVRNGGTRYALGDQINVLGTQLGGSSPENDLLITITAIDTGGTIIGSETYSNLTGINSTIPTNQAVFNVTRTRSTYSVAVIDRGVGYTGRSIVSYAAPGIGLRYYGCIKDTQTDRGVWDSNATYYTGDVVKYPFRSSSYYRVKNSLDGSVQEVQFVLPTDTDYWEVSDPILPTNREYWEEVSAGTFSSLATPWKAYVTATSEGNLGDLIKYRSGSTILIPGTTLGGDTPSNDLLIRVSPNLPITTVGTFETNSTVIVGSTATLRVDMPIIFTGSAVGGISSGSQYFVKEIINSSSFTIYSDPLTKQIVRLTSASSPTANPMKFIDNSIRNFTISGVAKSGISFSGISAGLGSYSDVIGTDISESGSGVIFELVRSNGRYSATVNVRGTRYNVGDQIRILGSDIGGAPEAYYMAISAPGALDNKGRIYLYSFDGIDWKQSDDNKFVGIFNPASDYASGSIVWYNNNYWRSTVPYFRNSGTTITTETVGWELVNSLNTGILPIQPAYPNDGSSIEVGLVGDQTPELLNVGDRYGYSTTMSTDASLLVVGAPFADTADLENYKGTWKSYQEYTRDDVVKIVELGQPTYYKLLAVESLNQLPVSGAVWEKVLNASEYNTGAVFVYLKNQENIYELVQTIDDNDIISDDLESGDELGFKVVLSREGNLLFVSAPDADIKEKDKGAVFVFKNVNNRFEYIQRLESYSFDFFERFGDEISVSPTADTIAITAGSAVASTLINFDRGETNFDYLLTRFRDPVGITGKVYIYNRYGDTFILSEAFDEELITGENFGKSLACFDDRVIIGSPAFKSSEDAFLGSVIGKVQTFRKYKNINAWSPLRSQEPAVDLTLLKSLSLFDSDSNIKLLDVDVIDPLNGKILSVAEQELKFKTSYDPAVYSVGTSADPSRAWFDNMTGYLWWDTSTVKWANYNQGDISYKLGGWNSVAYGSSIDVYEWVETEYLPSEWAEIATTAEAFSVGVSGTPLYPDNSSYSVKENLDTLTGRVSSRVYYYWVKDKATLPTNKNFRKIASSSVAQYIQNPLGTGITFAALIDNEKIAIYNPTIAITGNNVSVTIQFYKNSKQINQVHREYQLLTEGVADSLPSSDLENKWIDSLIGYDITGKDVPDFKLPTKFKYGLSSRPRQSMFVDGNKAIQITLDFVNNILKTRPFAEIINTARLNSFEIAPADVKNLYDRTVENKEELALVSTSKISPAILKANIANGKIDTVDVIDPGYGYRVSPPIVVTGSGSGAVLRANIDRLGRVTSVTVVKPGEKYLSAALSVRQFAVLVKTDSTVRNYWSIYSWNEKSKEFYRTATQSYDTRNYWTTSDWWADGFSEKSRITNEIVGLYQESEVNLTIGQLLRIREYGSGSWAVLERTSQETSTILDKYRLVGRSNGTIQISESFINTENNSTGYDKTTSFDSNGYDQSSAREFRIILESIKNDIFVDDLRVEWNKLFFANIHYAFSEQLYVDWAFKTSFVNATHNVGNLTQKITYKSDNLPSYQKYIEEVKPYRTKIREYTSRYIRTENTSTSFSDFDVPSVYNPDTNSIEPVKIISTEIDTYPWKYWLDNYKYSVTDIQISNVGSGYKTVPIVVFEGGGGTGASARAFISNGKVSRIVLTNSGTGYTSAPTVKLVGGVGTNLSNSATAIAVIGNSKARTFDLSMKFDRVSKTSTFTAKALDEKFKEIQTFTGTGSKTVFELKYPAALDKTKVNVYTKLVTDQTDSPGQKLLTGQYSVSIDTNKVNGLTVQIGKLILNSAPAKNILVTVEYEKNDQSLDSLNRIDKYYNPKDGMIGLEKTIIRDDVTQEIIKVDYDYSQLMTGIDFGGVVVQGATLDVSGGWDALPWFTEGWDSVDSLNSDFYVTADGTTNTFVLPEAPANGQAINIYLRNSVTGIYERIDDTNYTNFVTVLQGQNLNERRNNLEDQQTTLESQIINQNLVKQQKLNLLNQAQINRNSANTLLLNKQLEISSIESDITQAENDRGDLQDDLSILSNQRSSIEIQISATPLTIFVPPSNVIPNPAYQALVNQLNATVAAIDDKQTEINDKQDEIDALNVTLDALEAAEAPLILALSNANSALATATTEYNTATQAVVLSQQTLNQVLQNILVLSDAPIDTAVMDTFIGDGSTLSIVIPPVVTIQDGDVLIFRPDTSDGSLTITDVNLIDADVSGGLLSSNTTGNLVAPNAINGAYSTATGLTAAEIVIEGDKFISPDQVPAPEENIPGQVLESVSIKVFHSDRQGAPAILSRIYNADGTTSLYGIGQTILENSSVIVFVDKVKQEIDVDYTFESDTQQIRFLTAPTNNSLIEIFSISIGGVEILDYREFVGDGSNRYFLTAASYAEAGRVFATVDYSSTPVAFVNSNGVVNNVDKALVEFGIAPPNGSKISIIVLSGESGTSNSIVRANYQTITVTNSSQRTYSVTDFIELQASATGNVIVELNNKLLRCADTVIQPYDGTNRVVNVGRDPLRPFGGIVQAQVRAYVNNIPLVFGIEYEFSAATNSVNVIKQNINHGDVIRVETYENVQYEIINNNLVLSNDVILTVGDTINIIWFDRYSSVDLVKDIRTGGQLNYPLQRAPLGVSYVWVYKNGDRLTPDVDFYIDYPRNTVYLKDSNTEDDEIEMISFATEIYKQPFAFEIFKDILNSHHYNRYTVTDVKLTKELNYYDNELEVNDATTLSTPQLKLPGIVTINGERIEYLQKVGNLLKDLRRGTLGTSIAITHPIDSYVVDVGYQEIVPYKESQDRYDFVADGSSEIYTGLPFVPLARKNQQGTLVEFTYTDTIPDNFYPCDTIEVFVQGRRLRKDPITVYDSTVGSYSPAGDVTIEAEFSVDNQTNSIRITQTPPAGARITVIKRTGKVWYNQGADEVTTGITLSQNTTPIAKFLQQRTTKLL